MHVDNLLKSLAERYPDQIAAWLLNVPVEDLSPVENVKTELSGEAIRADFVAFLRGPSAILHVEFVFSPPRSSETPYPLRMLDYWVRLHRLYRVAVHQALVLVTPRSGADPGAFEEGATRHAYRVIRLWEEDPAPFLTHEGLLPLAVLARTEDRRALVSEVAARVRRIEPAERRQETAAAAKLLAGLIVTWKEIHIMFGQDDWYKESSVYQHFVEEGRAEEAYLLLLGVIESRFGASPPELRASLGRCSLELLRRLTPVAATCASIEAFEEAVDQLGVEAEPASSAAPTP